MTGPLKPVHPVARPPRRWPRLPLELFTGLDTDENAILRQHLVSGWYKQAAVYPELSEPWKEIKGAVHDHLHEAWQLRWQAEHEPEAGQ